MEEKYIEKEETGRAEISLAVFFTILKSKILLIVAITVVALAVGGVFAFLSVPKYTASGSVMINVKLDVDKNSYNDTILTEKYLPTFVEFAKSGVVMAKANEIYDKKVDYYEASGIELSDTSISASLLTLETEENVFIVDFSYTEPYNGNVESTKLAVKEKLNSIIDAIDALLMQTTGDIEGDNKEFFTDINMTTSRMYNEIGVYSTDSKVKIMIFSAIIGIVLGIIVALLIEYLDETVKSLDDVRKITKVKTVIGMEELQNRGKK